MSHHPTTPITWLIGYLAHRLTLLERKVNMLAQELADGLDALGTQIATVQAEVKNVEDVLAGQASPNQVPDAVVQAFGRLKAATQGLVDVAAALPAPSAADASKPGDTGTITPVAGETPPPV